MTQLFVILTEDGVYDSAYADTEVELKVLKRGQDDAKIDQVESEMEPIE